MADESEDKTEEPTGKRLEQARKEGNVAQTTEAKVFATMLSALIVVGILSPGVARDLAALMHPFVDRPHTIFVDAASIRQMLIDVGLGVMRITAWPMAVVMIFAAGISLLQTSGLLWVPKKIAPDLKKLSPMQGLKRIFGPAQMVELAKAFAKMGILGSVLAYIIIGGVEEMTHLPMIEFDKSITYIKDQVYVLIFVTLMLVLVLAAADFVYQKWRHHEKMKMSKQEVKDEHKQQEGDPQVKAKIRSLRVRRARQRMMASVPKADVVVTNPTHFAVALKYDPETMNAPVLVAKGVDHLAKKIRELAEENDVPIVENPPLARALHASVEIDQEVPQEHYKAVAEVIGYVMRLKGTLAH
ncbi:MAG: flagellar biosynthesis protein FlhB [Pseudomonadota bacterium]